jgi:hypothetical protein
LETLALFCGFESSILPKIEKRRTVQGVSVSNAVLIAKIFLTFGDVNLRRQTY